LKTDQKPSRSRGNLGLDIQVALTPSLTDFAPGMVVERDDVWAELDRLLHDLSDCKLTSCPSSPTGCARAAKMNVRKDAQSDRVHVQVQKQRSLPTSRLDNLIEQDGLDSSAVHPSPGAQSLCAHSVLAQASLLHPSIQANSTDFPRVTRKTLKNFLIIDTEDKRSEQVKISDSVFPLTPASQRPNASWPDATEPIVLVRRRTRRFTIQDLAESSELAIAEKENDSQLQSVQNRPGGFESESPRLNTQQMQKSANLNKWAREVDTYSLNTAGLQLAMGVLQRRIQTLTNN